MFPLRRANAMSSPGREDTRLVPLRRAPVMKSPGTADPLGTNSAGVGSSAGGGGDVGGMGRKDVIAISAKGYGGGGCGGFGI